MTNTRTPIIEKHVPLPTAKLDLERYDFLKDMAVGDSFTVNTNSLNLNPKMVRTYMYGQNNKKSNHRRYAVRTTAGHFVNPIAIRVWRTK